MEKLKITNLERIVDSLGERVDIAVAAGVAQAQKEAAEREAKMYKEGMEAAKTFFRDMKPLLDH